jgi:hypothetical protein
LLGSPARHGHPVLSNTVFWHRMEPEVIKL